MWVQFSHNKFHTVTSLLLDDDDCDDNTRFRGGRLLCDTLGSHSLASGPQTAGSCVIGRTLIVETFINSNGQELRGQATIQCSAVQPGLVISHRYRLHRRIGAKRSFSGTSRILGTVIKVVVLALSSTCCCCWEGMVDSGALEVHSSFNMQLTFAQLSQQPPHAKPVSYSLSLTFKLE